MSNVGPHSHEVLTDARDLFWNQDFLALMATRWRLTDARRVLDVGCGLLHWTRALLPHLPKESKVTAVDPEAQWVKDAGLRVEQLGLEARIEVQQARVEALPFGDGTFDLVTCQTVLMHVPDAEGAIKEMVRVLRPGGLLAVAEPNNLAEALVRWSAHPMPPLEAVLDFVRLEAIVERGKAALGEGDSSIGERLPGLFAQAGLTEVSAHGCDKCTALIPPYRTEAERTEIAERKRYTLAELVTSGGSRERAKRFYLAGGGTPADFERLYEAALGLERGAIEAIERGELLAAGGSIFYLVAGRKPLA